MDNQLRGVLSRSSMSHHAVAGGALHCRDPGTVIVLSYVEPTRTQLTSSSSDHVVDTSLRYDSSQISIACRPTRWHTHTAKFGSQATLDAQRMEWAVGVFV